VVRTRDGRDGHRARSWHAIEESAPSNVIASMPAPDDVHAIAILAYLNQRGYRMASFDRLRRRIDENLTDQQFNDIISKSPAVFRHARLADGKPGIAKLI